MKGGRSAAAAHASGRGEQPCWTLSHNPQSEPMLLRTISVIGVVVAVPLVLVACAALLLYRFENVVSTCATRADAERDRALERGWIPGFMPRSARAIREVHN